MTFRFGIQLVPAATRLDEVLHLARVADSEGLDLLGMQDHPYAPTHADAFSVMTTVLAQTNRIHVFPDVASLPLRGPAILAKTAAALDHLSNGRFDLGLGAGAFWPPIQAMGGPHRTNPAALQALEEAIEIIRALWSEEPAHVAGEHYSINGARGGPPPSRPIEIWLGSVGPRANALTGRLGDGWAAPIPHYLPYEKWRSTQDLIDAAATDTGRDPSEITRMAQLVGDITTTPGTSLRLQGEDPIRTSARDWARILADLATDARFDTFVYWPENPTETQLRRWVHEVVPATQELLAHEV